MLLQSGVTRCRTLSDMRMTWKNLHLGNCLMICGLSSHRMSIPNSKSAAAKRKRQLLFHAAQCGPFDLGYTCSELPTHRTFPIRIFSTWKTGIRPRRRVAMRAKASE
jgi:hypothetical protein